MPWAVAMDWRDAMFLHWRADAGALRRILPTDLELDLYDGAAWISIVAFRITGARLRGVPRFAGLPPFNEINVRTYVRDAEKPGVWFLSLDAANALAVWTGRRALHLPYVNARIEGSWDGATYAYRSARIGPTTARFDATVHIATSPRIVAPGSLQHWLAERYCFFTVDDRGRSLRGDVEHEPWPLHDGTPSIAANTLLAAANVTPLDEAPLAHASPGVSTRARPVHPAAANRAGGAGATLLRRGVS
jgi:uncharacterized protein YqjF (DUF2071 family)